VAQFQITTTARVNAKRGNPGNGQDSLIGTLIDSVSQKAEETMGRKLKRDTYVEVIPLRPKTRFVSLEGFPVTAVSSVIYAPTRDFTGLTAMDAASYSVLLEEGQIELHGLTYWYERGYVQVSYTGGMGVDTAAFVAAYPSIADSADNEIVARLNRAKNPDGNLQVLGQSVAFLKQMQPTDDFLDALGRHRRIRL
jgi:hypothetical protein